MKKSISLILLLGMLQMHSQVIKKGKNTNGNNLVNETKEPPPFVFLKQSMLSLSMSDIAFTNITARYEFFRKDGMVGYQIPFSFNAGGVPDSSNYRPNNIGRFLSARNRIFQTGLNINYYLNGQDKVAPYVGLSFAAGWFNYWKYTYTSSGSYYNIYTTEKLIGNYYSFAFHGGLLFNPRETLTFGLKAGFGLRRYATIYTEYTYPFFLCDVSAGFKF